jgi:hypothetical protein
MYVFVASAERHAAAAMQHTALIVHVPDVWRQVLGARVRGLP